MTGTDALIDETVSRLAGDLLADRPPGSGRGTWDVALWEALGAAGLAGVGVPEALGGSGGTTADAVAVARALARAAAAVPFADATATAGWARARLGAPLAPGVVAMADPVPAPTLDVARAGSGWRLDGELRSVRWLPAAEAVVAVAASEGGPLLVTAPLGAAGAGPVEPGVDLAGDPVGTVAFTATALAGDQVLPLGEGLELGDLQRHGALVRSGQVVGALEALVPLVVAHARDREQFGRPLARFQAVQQLLARIAGELVAAQAALDLALEDDAEGGDGLAVAAAKVRAGEAATTASRLAHQVVGAVGFTEEHPLCEFTRRLWCWRDELGDDGLWAAWLGERVLAGGGAGLWPLLTSRPAPR